LKEQCPMLEKCRKVIGIDCTDRDFQNCDFFKNLLRDCKNKSKYSKYLKKSVGE